MFHEFYQNLPLMINPIALRVGFFSLTWYSLMYLVAFLAIYFLLRWRIKNDAKYFSEIGNIAENLENFFIYSIIGIVIGARLGYVFFYDPHFFLANPWSIVSPFDATGNFVGIYGLSYHGGLVGVILAGIFFTRKYKISFWRLADFVIPAVSAGYFFGRVGNFLNRELYGRITDSPLGMYFLDENNLVMLRHPSQLYEAFFEGIVLFIFFWVFRNDKRLAGKFLPLYVLGYGLIRFFIEFYRQPDSQIGLVFNVLTLGQIFCLIMVVASLIFLWYNLSKEYNQKNKP